MNNLNLIGLNQIKAQELTKILNELLANYAVFYQNVRGYHWNIKGEKFFELHLKFEELYNDLILKIDEIAERILTLGGIPKHLYSDYKVISTIKESLELNDGLASSRNILKSLMSLIILQREILAMASIAQDEGTGALMGDYIRDQEKLIWMYSSFLDTRV